MKKYFGDSSLPLIKELRGEQRRLRGEREKMSSEILNDKRELDEMKNMRKNVEVFLGSGDDLGKERYGRGFVEIE